MMGSKVAPCKKTADATYAGVDHPLELKREGGVIPTNDLQTLCTGGDEQPQ